MEELVPVLLTILVIILICRELSCWYLKINQLLEVLKDIRDFLKKDEPTFISEFKKAYNEPAVVKKPKIVIPPKEMEEKFY
jgi:hypothetical protein